MNQTYSKKLAFINFAMLTLLSSIIISNALIVGNAKFSYVILVLFIPILFLILIVGKFKDRFILSRIYKRKITKLILILYLFLSFIFMTIISVNIINQFFYFSMPDYFFIIVSVFVTMYIASLSNNNLVNLSFTIFVILLLINLLRIFNVSKGTYDFIIHDIQSFKFDFNFEILLLSGLFLDGIILFFYNDDNKRLSKKWYIISTCLGVVMSIFIMLENYLHIPYQFLNNSFFPSFTRYKMTIGPKYIEHFDVLLLINTIILIIIKCAISLRTLRLLLKIKQNFKNQIILSFFFILLIELVIQFFNLNMKTMYYCSLFLGGLLLLFYLNFFIFRRKNHENT